MWSRTTVTCKRNKSSLDSISVRSLTVLAYALYSKKMAVSSVLCWRTNFKGWGRFTRFLSFLCNESKSLLSFQWYSSATLAIPGNSPLARGNEKWGHTDEMDDVKRLRSRATTTGVRPARRVFCCQLHCDVISTSTRTLINSSPYSVCDVGWHFGSLCFQLLTCPRGLYRLRHGYPHFSWQRTTPFIVGSFAGRTWQHNSKWCI
jgi:hypothetical protein